MAVARGLMMSMPSSRPSGPALRAYNPPLHRYPSNQALLRAQRSTATVVQLKLRLSQPEDASEGEADAVADRFISGHGALAAGITTTPTPVSRVCKECDDEIREPDVVSRQEDESASGLDNELRHDDEDDAVEDSEPDVTGMPKRRGGAALEHVPAGVVPQGAGSSLPRRAHEAVSRGFGRSFDQVRIHTDAAAARSAARIGALAYTVGNHVYFGAGQFAPATSPGARLLAHELTHVVQQQRNGHCLARRRRRGRRSGGSQARNICTAGGCPQGKQPKVVRNDCGESGPVDERNVIKHLEVSLSGQTVVATWSNGRTDSWPCSPNPRVTPRGDDRVGTKCGINHTNRKRAGMAWFTGFRSEGLRIGFHDSQRVGTGIRSHGCVRVCCSIARLINRNTWSRTTTIHVS